MSQPDDPDADAPEVHTNEEIGTRVARFPRVAADSAHVEVPDPVATDPTITIRGETYDDEPGYVTVSVSAGVSVSLALDPEEARQLGERLRDAADEAEVEI